MLSLIILSLIVFSTAAQAFPLKFRNSTVFASAIHRFPAVGLPFGSQATWASSKDKDSPLRSSSLRAFRAHRRLSLANFSSISAASIPPLWRLREDLTWLL